MPSSRASRSGAATKNRLPPHNAEAERSVLGGILRDPDVLPRVRELLRPADFFSDAHQRLYRALLTLAHDRQPIDLVLLKDYLKREGQLDDVGGHQAIGDLFADVPTGANAEHHAQLVRDVAKVRDTIHAANEILRDAYDRTGSADELLAMAERKFAAISRGASANGNHASRIVSRSLAEIEARDVRWLWPGRIPFAMLTMLDGDPCKGKSLITLDLAAKLSRGGPMPFSTGQFEPGAVLIVAAEDSAEETIKPRCVAAGADERLVRVCENVKIGEHERPIRLPDDFRALEREVAEFGAKLLIIDPLLGFLAQAVDSHKDQSVRDVLHELKLLAGRTGAAVVGLRHFNKSGQGNALYRGLGSIAIVAAARVALAVDEHPGDKDTLVLAATKCNIAKMPRSVTFSVADGEIRGQPVVRWGSECDLTAADLTPKFAGGHDHAIAEAKEFLRDLLSAGPVKASEVEKHAAAAGVSKGTLQRAKKALGVESQKDGFSSTSWVWGLPKVLNQIPD